MTQHKEISDETVHTIDQEVRVIIDKAYATATKVLESHKDKLHLMAEALLKYETLNADQIKDIMEGKPPREPEGWDVPDPKHPHDTGNTVMVSTEEKPAVSDDHAQGKPVK